MRSVIRGGSSDFSSREEAAIIVLKVLKLVTVVESNQKAPFSKATTPRCRGGHYCFPWIAPLYTYLIILSVTQGGIKYHFKSIWYDATWD